MSFAETFKLAGKLNPWDWLTFLYETFGHKHPIFSACLITACCAAVGLCVWWRLDVQYNTTHPDVAVLFNPIYPKYSERLGSPLGEADSSYAYQGVHDHATVLWLNQQKAFFQLPNSPLRKWVRLPDSDWADGRVYRDQDLIPQFRRFHLPEGRLPPYGGIAHRWLSDPENWEWIGWRNWDCYFQPNDTFAQTFQNGMMLGPFSLSPKNKATQVFVLFNDGTWLAEQSAAESRCGTPPSRNS